jgi:predicted DNA-binding transcriptional regulator AlpA
MTVVGVPSIAELLAVPARVAELPPAVAAEMLVKLLALEQGLAVRALAAAPSDKASGASVQDKLLTVKEAASVLGVSVDWLYGRADRLPFTVRLGRALRFSSLGIERYVRARRGAEGRT